MKTALLLSAAMLLYPMAAVASEAADADAGPAIIVIGHSDGYSATSSVTATKTDTPLIDVPQSVNIVTREQLDDQAHHSIADVLRYVPGATVGQGEGNRDQITLRGQNTSADFFLDGVRDDVQYYRSLYNIERVEVLKGPYAMIFGRGGGGGIVNRVQKTPRTDDLAIAGAASVNSFGAFDISADVNAPINDAAAFRINGVYEELKSHRDFYDGERYAVNPYAAVTLGEGWSAGLSYEYVHDDRVTDRGIPSLACTAPCIRGPLSGNRDTFFGVPGVNRTGIDAHIVKARLDGELAEGVKWSTTLLYGDYDKFYTNVYASGAATAVRGTVALGAYSDVTTRQNFIAQSNLVADLDLAGLGNTILLGVEYGDQDSANQRSNGVLSSATLDLSNVVYPTVAFPAISRQTRSAVRFLSAYAQDQVSIGEHIDVVAGIRYDRFEIDGTDVIDNNRRFTRTDEKVSPRFGVILKPRANISVYASYSRSFLPRAGDQFLSLSVTNQSLDPEKFTNYEAGVKWDVRPDLSVTAAVFQLDRTNTGVPDPNIPGQQFLTDTRTRGVELAVTGRILPHWQVSGGYTYQDAHRRNDETVKLGQVPKHQFALWNRYDFNSAVGAGLGVVHQSSQWAAILTGPTVTRLPAFTRVDAAVFLKASDRVELQVNVENLLDETYFSDAHNSNNISTGAPINARLTARMKF